MQYNAIQCNTLQYNAIPCNATKSPTVQYPGIPYNGMIQSGTPQHNTGSCDESTRVQFLHRVLQRFPPGVNKSSTEAKRVQGARVPTPKSLPVQEIGIWRLPLHLPASAPGIGCIVPGILRHPATLGIWHQAAACRVQNPICLQAWFCKTCQHPLIDLH